MEKLRQQINELTTIINVQQKQIDLLLAKNDELKLNIKKTQDAVADFKNTFMIDQRKNDMKFWQLFNNHDETEFDLKKRFFKEMPKASGILAIAQRCELAIMKIIHKACTENDIAYWIDYGTLIGAIRHEGFIPWDDDIDICMTRENIDKLEKVLKNHPDVELKHYYGYKPDGLIHYIRVCFKALENCFVDIFMYDYMDEDSPELISKAKQIRDAFRVKSKAFPKMSPEKYEAEFLKSFKELDNVINHKKQHKAVIWTTENFSRETAITYKYEDIFPVQEMKFADTVVYAPKEALKVLTGYYGDIFTLPNDVGVNKHFHYNNEQLELMKKLADKFEPIKK